MLSKVVPGVLQQGMELYTRLRGEHVEHDDVQEDVDRLKMSSECRKRAAEDDSHTLRYVIVYLSCNILMVALFY